MSHGNKYQPTKEEVPLSKHAELRQLFSSFQDTGLSCPHEKECNVREGEAKYPAYLGDEDTRVMVVAEAPSTANGVGPNVVQLFSEVTKSPKNLNMLKLRDFVQDYYNTTPHFTDLAKCGVVGKSPIPKNRVDICTKHFLLNEIDILKPEYVICVGKRSEDFFKKLKEQQEISDSVKLRFLTHYSNQAQLHLTIEDKYGIVWKWQARLLSEEDFIGELPKLSFFRKSPH